MAALGVRPPEWNDNYKAKIKKIFDRCDDDQSGTVSLDELGRALAADKDLCRILGIDPRRLSARAHLPLFSQALIASL